ncbi:hypothetical protein [Acidocella sp.]|uniref:hypothetical protein n=1 Tax=Acidocella sp. TaxID=50710 RepID=UPI002616CCBD|nr:hypothetical protein [Acidocella sp.]MDD2794397.1 hypothetical protein [Acidocella sp.]
MHIILPHAHFDAAHLEAVKAEMLTLGAPAILAIDCGDHYVALEGAHRIRAAHDLGLTPVIIEVEYDADAETDDVAPGSYQDNYTLAEIVGRAHKSVPMEF